MANYAKWNDTDLTTITIQGANFQVDKRAAPNFKGFLNDLAASGYKFKPATSGGYNYRTIRGSSRLSQHAYGNAIDVNWNDNAQGQRGTDLPANTQALADKWGLEWGMNFRNPDPMHFEWTGKSADGIAAAGGGAEFTGPAETTTTGGESGGSKLDSRDVPQAIDTQTAAEQATKTGIAQASQAQDAGFFASALGFGSDLFGRAGLIGMGLIVLGFGVFWFVKNAKKAGG